MLPKKEIEEFEIWFKENKYDLSENHVKQLQKNLYYRKFVNCKIDGNYKECLNMLMNSKINIFSIKNLIILFPPATLLRKFLWFHLD